MLEFDNTRICHFLWPSPLRHLDRLMPVSYTHLPTTTQQQSQSAVKNTKDFGNYDVVMRDDAIGQNKNAPVDYYMLALSWSPAFCEKQRAQYGNNLPDSAQYQCSTKNQFGWVVHGLSLIHIYNKEPYVRTSFP